MRCLHHALLLLVVALGFSSGTVPPALAEPPPVFVTRWGGAGGPIEFSAITGIAVGPDHNVSVADGGDHTRIVRFSPDGVFLREQSEFHTGWLAFDSTGRLFSVNSATVELVGSGDWHPAGFTTISGMLILPSDHILLSDGVNPILREYTPAGQIVRDWGPPGSGAGAITHTVLMMVGIPGGDVFVYPGVKRFSPSGEYVSTLELGIDIPMAASSTRIYAARYNDLLVHVLTLDGQPLYTFGDENLHSISMIAVDGESIYVVDNFVYPRIFKFSYAPVAVTPATWSQVKTQYK